MNSQNSNFVQILNDKAKTKKNKDAFIFLENGSLESEKLTYAELNKRVVRVGGYLQSVCQPGDRVLLIFQQSLDFFISVLGCCYAGVIAVTTSPPNGRKDLDKPELITKDCKPVRILTSQKLLEDLSSSTEEFRHLSSVEWISYESISDTYIESWRYPELTFQSPALIQYTSGSTGNPKGIVLSHGNLVANQALIKRTFRGSENSVYVSWLPLFHDLGLIGTVLQSIYLGAKCILMPPISFLMSPTVWIKAISKYRGTIIGGPNFAYDVTARRFSSEDAEGLDLSSLNVAGIGAEPVRASTIELFTETFEPFGFRKEAFCPSYGLAENSLFVVGGKPDSKPLIQTFDIEKLESGEAVVAKENEKSIKLVGNGEPVLDQQLKIVDIDTSMELEHGKIGEIWISGKSKANDYYGRPDLSADTFKAHVQNCEGGFLRTGDRGFIYNNQLFICGRIKELLIIRGKNIAPNDVEDIIISCSEHFIKDATAAFIIDEDNEEKLIVVQELERRVNIDSGKIGLEARKRIAQSFGVSLHALVLIKPNNMPRTSSFKVKRGQCKKNYLNGKLKIVVKEDFSGLENQPVPDSRKSIPKRDDVIHWLSTRIQQEIRNTVSENDFDQPFINLGLNSVNSVNIIADLSRWLGVEISPAELWNYPNINDLVDYLGGYNKKEQEGKRSSSVELPSSKQDIAIIGLGCHFPKAESPEGFWNLLITGQSGVREVPENRWIIDEYFSEDQDLPGRMYTKYGCFVDNIDNVDSSFFKISADEAAQMDPQQLMLLMTSWHALEDAGITVESIAGSNTGVYVGISSYDSGIQTFSNPNAVSAYSASGNSFSIAANRLSYFYNLKGPSLSIDTACSSSLMALHTACNSLISHETDMNFVGGVNYISSPAVSICFSKAGILSKEGRCKTFDSGADGYVRGEGAGMVIIKRLEDAKRDKDKIYAVIKGTAINQDGKTNGLLAPNGLSQKSVIETALKRANIPPAEIDYVETHGTGTNLGDPIELEALSKVLISDRPLKQKCLIASVKSNIGHLEAAAGIASLIKVCVSIKNRLIPPSINCGELNPKLNWEKVPLKVNSNLVPWPNKEKLTCGISSFGFGGTNAHVVIQSPELTDQCHDAVFPNHPYTKVLTVSAHSKKHLRALCRKYIEHLYSHPEVSLQAVANASNTCRSHLDYRFAVVCKNKYEARAALIDYVEARRSNSTIVSKVGKSSRKQKLAFIFSGEGSQYADMGKALFQNNTIFRRSILESEKRFESYLNIPLTELLYGDKSQRYINRATYSQPAIFACEWALYQCLTASGVIPDVVLGHGIGEYVAATAAEMIDIEDAHSLVCMRGRLFDSVSEKGVMLALRCPSGILASILAQLNSNVVIAARNSYEDYVLSGHENGMEELEAILATKDILFKRLSASNALHWGQIDPMLETFREEADKYTYQSGKIPFISNVTGKCVDQDFTPSADYWANQIRKPVEFYKSLGELENLGIDGYIEVGPQATLLSLIEKNSKNDKTCLSLLEKGNETNSFMECLAALYVSGCNIDWQAADSSKKDRMIDLPNYPFSTQTSNRVIKEDVDHIHLMSGKEIKMAGPKIQDKEKIKETPSKNAALRIPVPAAMLQSSQDELISQLVDIEKDILGINEVDSETAFFDLGGDSLLAKKFISTVNERFKTNLEVADLFNYSTIEKLSEYLVSQSVHSVALAVPQAEKNPTVHPIEENPDHRVEGDIISEYLENLAKGETSIEEGLSLICR